METLKYIALSILAFDLLIGLFMWIWDHRSKPTVYDDKYDDEYHPSDQEGVEDYYCKDDF